MMGTAFLFGLIGLGLVLQYLRDVGFVGFQGNEDCWHVQQRQRLLSSGYLFALVFGGSPILGAGRGGLQWWW